MANGKKNIIKTAEKMKKKKFSHRMQKKLVGLFALAAILFVALVGRITYINAFNGSQYERKVLEQQNYSSRVIPYQRGDILDRNGTVLATSVRVYHVILDAKVLLATEEKVDATVEALVSQFDLDEETIRTELEESPESRYIVLKKDVDYDTAQAWNNLVEDDDSINEDGVWLEEDYKRTYPYGSLACDVIGFTSDGNVGNYGLEQEENDVLNGEDGREYGYLDASYGLERTVSPSKNGNTVVSTIDANLQQIVENKISAFNEAHKNQAREGNGAENIGVIMMDPDTGEVLAMASYPNFDLNNPRDMSAYYTQEQLDAMSDEEQLSALQSIWRNFCVSDTYEPGSTAKVFTVATGLECGVLNGSETYYCGGYLHVGDWDIKCHVYPSIHGTLTLSQAVAQSCNVALMEIAEQIGVENFCKYQKVFGFGEYTGIDLPGETDTSALLYNADNMGITDLATNSFGQNFNVSMIQMAAAYCSVVNGGTYYRPHVVKEIRNEDGETIETKSAEVLKQTITKDTSDKLLSYMLETVQSGTAKKAQVAGYSIAGKTGTAERLPRGNGEYVISFAGCAPAEDPEVMIYVVIDRPNAASQENTELVTQLSADIMTEALPYLSVKASQ